MNNLLNNNKTPHTSLLNINTKINKFNNVIFIRTLIIAVVVVAVAGAL